MENLISAAIAKFPKEFGLRGFDGERFRLSAESSYIDDNGQPVLYAQRKGANGEWQDFAKGTITEITLQITK